jgi:hypothetical protein
MLLLCDTRSHFPETVSSGGHTVLAFVQPSCLQLIIIRTGLCFQEYSTAQTVNGGNVKSFSPLFYLQVPLRCVPLTKKNTYPLRVHVDGSGTSIY